MRARKSPALFALTFFALGAAGPAALSPLIDSLTLPLWAEVATRVATCLGWGFSMGALVGPLWARRAIEAEQRKLVNDRGFYTTEELAERFSVASESDRDDDHL